MSVLGSLGRAIAAFAVTFALFSGVGFLLESCAEPQHPYVTLIVPPHDELAWFADGPEMGIVAHNPEPRPFSGWLECDATDRTYATRLPIELAPKGHPGDEEVVGLGQVMNRDVHANPCRLVRR